MATRSTAHPDSEKIKAIVAQRRQDAAEADGEKVTIEFRGERVHVYVISMPVDLLLLNPDTHRIRAQRSAEPARNAVLENDPWSSAAQDYLASLLACLPADPGKTDPDFEALRDNLKRFGQKDAGIITPDGVLVNGNTRCVALRSIGQQNIRVGVLPNSTTWSDINGVELSLQLRKDHKREYSYINRLLAIEEQIAAGRHEDDIANVWHIKVATLQQDRWVHSILEDAIARSASAGAALKLLSFENEQEKLRELHRAFMKLSATDRDAAESLREVRLAMIVLDYAKTDLRLAEGNFYEKYLEPKLPAGIKPHVAVSATPVAIPGLDLAVPEAGPSVQATRVLTDTLLKLKATAVSGAANAAQAATTLSEARAAFDRALEPAGRDTVLRKRKVAATERLADACDLLDLCVGDLAAGAATKATDEDAFDDAAIRLRRSLERLGKQAGRTFVEPKDGLAWLLDIVKESRDS